MNAVTIAATALAVTLAGTTESFANPALLPQHEGYPMGQAKDPVKGQPLGNDPGQTNASGNQALEQAAMAGDAHAKQQLRNHNDQRILEKPGAGVLPKVQGPQININPPVKEASKVQANPQ